MTSALLIYPYFLPRHDKSIFRFPPLGLGYVAASLRNAGYNVEIMDCTFLDRKSAVEKALHTNADIVGIYSMVTMREDSIALAKVLRNRCDLLIAGGPLPSCDPILFHGPLRCCGEGCRRASHTAGIECLPGKWRPRGDTGNCLQEGERRPGQGARK
ncbi:MAG: cobalamin B12-binding domain-containing protein, partial [Chloroflexi bacterium]|nr:cobalamin B12-binding domain-containing protein [Chloroflexota bacterium]